MRNDLTKRLTRTAIIAAIYAVITIAIAPLSYMGVQFRIGELLVLLALFDPIYIYGLTLGCLIDLGKTIQSMLSSIFLTTLFHGISEVVSVKYFQSSSK